MYRLTAALLGLGFSDSRLITGISRRMRLQSQPSRWAQLTLIPLQPWRSVRLCAAYVRQHSEALRDIHGVGTVRQFLALLWAQLGYGVGPEPFSVCFALAVKGRRKWDGYLGTAQVNTVLVPLARRSDDPLRAELGDKRTFPAWAARHALPVVPLIAVFEAGGVAWSGAAALPGTDLFAKPADFWGGFGAERWRWAGAGWVDHDGRASDEAQITERLRQLSQDRPYVLQRCLTPHPALRPFTTFAVVTVRAVTGVERDGRARLLRASVRLPMSGAIVDNVSSGGMVAAVNLNSGELESGVRWRPDGMVQHTDRHPSSGTSVTGFMLPDWDDVIRLAERAHGAAPSLPLIGWDVALTADGPQLLEANFGFGPDIVTVPQRVPLSESGFCQIVVRSWFGGVKS